MEMKFKYKNVIGMEKVMKKMNYSNYNGSIDKSSNIKPFMTWYYCFVDNKLITK